MTVARLLDRLRRAPAAVPTQRMTAEQVALLSQTWSSEDSERVLPTFVSYSQAGYLGNSVVFSCINARMRLGAQAVFRFRNRTTKRMYGTQALAKLEQPWPGATTGELIARMIQHADLAGNAFVHDLGDRLEVLVPDRVVIMAEERPDGSREVVGYVYDRAGNGRFEESFDVATVAHWSPVPDPLASFRGMSWLTPVVREVNNDLAMTDYQVAYFANAATPNMLIKYPTTLTATQVAAIRDAWNGSHQGPDNGFKTAILDSGADLTVVGNSFEQMTFVEVRAANENRIAAAAGVPAIVAGLKEGLDQATYSNYGMAYRAFADTTMADLWRGLCSVLAKLVDVPPGSDLWYDTTDIPALRDAETDRATAAQTYAAAASGFITAGYDPTSVLDALTSGDMSLLKHTGMVSVQLQMPGQPSAGPAADDGDGDEQP